jgi:hypothetical protein
MIGFGIRGISTVEIHAVQFIDRQSIKKEKAKRYYNVSRVLI